MTSASPTPSPRTKKPWLLIVVSIVVVAVMVAGILAALNGLGRAFQGLGANSGYSEKFAAYEAVNKNFTVGQTMELGPLDVTATSVSRNIKPSSEELTYLTQQMNKKSNRSYYEQFGNLDSSTTQYVQVRLTAQYNQARGEKSGVLFAEIDPFENSINAFELNGQSPLLYWVNGTVQPYYRPSDTVIAQLKSGQPVELVYLYKIAPAEKGTATATVTAFKKTSSIVGTEGMPREDVMYSLQLW